MTEIIEMPTVNGESIRLKRYGVLCFADADGLDPEWGASHAKNFRYRPGDVILSSYPKSGTHWLGNMAMKLRSLDETKRPIDTLLEFGPAEVYDAYESPRYIFTHIKPSGLPEEHIKNEGKIVLTIRSPKDAMVSYYHHLKDAVYYRNKQTWDEFFECYIKGIVPFGSYFDFVQQWEEFLKEKPKNVQVEIFYYEDLKTNLNENLARLNKFLGCNRDQDYMNHVKKSTTLAALKEQDAAGKRATNPFVRDEKGKSVIYRRGEVGTWRNYLTVAQSETVDRIMSERLKHGLIKRYQI